MKTADLMDQKDFQHMMAYIQQNSGLKTTQIQNTLKLFAEDCTIPFITRYRKEVTGGLDEVQVQQIKDLAESYQEQEKRRAYILEAIEKQGKMTEQLKSQILNASSLSILEDIYAPYKVKKKTKGQKAIEAGLEPLAIEILNGIKGDLEQKAQLFFNTEKDIKTVEDALSGASDIICEKIAHDSELKEVLRKDFWKGAHFVSEKRSKAEEVSDFEKYRDYFEFRQPIEQLTHPKTAHRVLAMRRAMSLKILKVYVDYPSDQAEATIKKKYIPSAHPQSEFLEQCVQRAYSLYIYPALDLEIKSQLKTTSDEAAIDVFGINLKNLLLQPYLGSKAVMGIDPGIRTGCKLAIISDSGELLFDTVFYPQGSHQQVEQSQQIIEALVERFQIKYIAVGNGTFGRETLKFIRNLAGIKKSKTNVTLINEDGASIYSTSAIAREEFPDKDPTVRGAVSIARRFQDPLAELVKIDPKSIGVGQYQHDVNQARLKKTLSQTVESCVNFVGVDLNTASAPLLSFVSGIGSGLAKNIVSFRHKIGGFKTREQLKEISRFSEKVFEQSAGFLRIYGGAHPLDQTSIHPERYSILENWAKNKKINLADLVGNNDLIGQFESDQEIRTRLGDFTHDDIIKDLKAPGKDPREEFKGDDFRDDISELKDIKVGEYYPGVVTNITQFGAFVDIGIKENGLIHVSEMADHFVSNPLDEVKVGQSVKARVIEVDHQRGRIAMSLKSDSSLVRGHTNKDAHDKRPPKNNRGSSNKQQELEKPKSPFAALKNLKL